MFTKSSKSSESNTLNAALQAQFGERVKENCPLAPFMRAGVGGVAEYLLEAQTVDEISRACSAAQIAKRPCVVIGSGTGSLASHVGALGLVVVNRAAQIHFAEESSLVVAEAGTKNAQLISAAASRGLGGLEFLTGIPGTIGGAVVTDAVYQGKSLQSFVRSVVCWVAEGAEARVVTLPYVEARKLFHSTDQVSNSAIRPVVLAVHIQFSKLYPDEVLRRLRAYRQRSELINSPHSIVGRPFAQQLIEYPLLRRDIERLRSSGLSYQALNDVVQAKKGLVQPTQIRSYIDAIKRLASDQGVVLDDRITYLGYWPDEGENESE